MSVGYVMIGRKDGRKGQAFQIVCWGCQLHHEKAPVLQITDYVICSAEAEYSSLLFLLQRRDLLTMTKPLLSADVFRKKRNAVASLYLLQTQVSRPVEEGRAPLVCRLAGEEEERRIFSPPPSHLYNLKETAAKKGGKYKGQTSVGKWHVAGRYREGGIVTGDETAYMLLLFLSTAGQWCRKRLLFARNGIWWEVGMKRKIVLVGTETGRKQMH